MPTAIYSAEQDGKLQAMIPMMQGLAKSGAVQPVGPGSAPPTHGPGLGYQAGTAA
jgi:hypothetical protein